MALEAPEAAYALESGRRCRRGGSVYCLLAMLLLLGTGPLDLIRFPTFVGRLLAVRLAGAAALGVVIGLLRSPRGARHPRALALLGPVVVGALLDVLGAVTGGPRDFDVSVSFAILGMAVLVPWSAVWSALACVLVVGGHVGSAFVAQSGVWDPVLRYDLLAHLAASGIAVVVTAVLQRQRRREFMAGWALDVANREAGEAAQRYRSVVETAGSAIVVLAPDGRITEFNREAERLFGWSRGEAIGCDFEALCMPGAFRGRSPTELLNRYAAEVVRGVETVMVTRDGRALTVFCTATGLTDEDGRVSGVIVCGQDITERKHAEIVRRESEARLRAVVANVPVILFTLDRNGTITLSDGKGLERFGLAPGEVVGANVFEVVRGLGEEAAQYGVLLDRVFSGESVTWQGSFGGATCESRVTPIRDAEGTVTGALGITIDVTARQQAEDARFALERRLHDAQKLESLGVLAGGVAHDFNNLLVSVLGNASLALGELPADSPARSRLEQVEIAARRGSDLTRQMLAYAGQASVSLEAVDVNALLDEMDGLLRVSIGRRVQTSYRLEQSLPAVTADPTQIRQVILNLITNAADAIGEAPGTIRVRTSMVHLDEAALHAAHRSPDASAGPYLCLEVADSGCGMDAVTMERIFDPFFSTKFTGRGLGLATVLGVVRRHGGALAVQSEPGCGATFQVFLPLTEGLPRSEEQGTEPDTAGATPAGRMVLLVDDEEDVRAVTQHMLERLGCHVLVAGNGREGIDVFRAHAHVIDAAIVDLTLPRLGGEETFREMRAIRSDACVILTSGYTDEPTTRRLVQGGVAGFLRKPFSLADLQAVMGRVLPVTSRPPDA